MRPKASHGHRRFDHEVPARAVWRRVPLGRGTPEQQAESMKAWDDFTNATIEAGVYLGGEGLQPSATATTVPHPGERRPDRQRRPVRRDQGAARRLLPARLQGPRRRARLGQADPHARRHGGGPAGHGLRGSAARRPTRTRRGPPGRRFRRKTSTACSGASRGGRSPPSSACSATSISPRRRCRTHSWWRSSAGRATACRTTRPRGSSAPRATGAIDVLRRSRTP